MLTHDLRLERVERAVLNLARGRDSDSRRGQRRGDQVQEPIQSDDLDRLAEGAADLFLFSDSGQGLQDNASLEDEVS